MEKTMKVEKDKLVNFLQLIELQGDITNKEAILNIKPDKMTVLAVTSNKMVALRGEMQGKFDMDMQIGLDDITLLRKFLSSFTSTHIDVQVKENKLVLTGKDNKLKISSILRNPKYIINNLEEEKFKSFKEKSTGNEIVLGEEIITKIIGYVEVIGSKNLVLEGKDKTLILKLESNQNKIVAEFTISKSFKPFTVKLSQVIVYLLSVLNDKVNISIKENAPVYIKTGNKDYTFEYVVAPISK